MWKHIPDSSLRVQGKPEAYTTYATIPRALPSFYVEHDFHGVPYQKNASIAKWFITLRNDEQVTAASF